MDIYFHNFWDKKIIRLFPTIEINFNEKVLGIAYLCFAISFELR